MSDIAIRFDGLLFGCVIAVSGLLLLLAALVFAVRAHSAQTNKAGPKSIARACALGCLACLASFAALVFYMETAGTPMSGPNWLDVDRVALAGDHARWAGQALAPASPLRLTLP